MQPEKGTGEPESVAWGRGINQSSIHQQPREQAHDYEVVQTLMELVRGSQTQFYNEYFAARVIKHLGTRHRPAQARASKPGGGGAGVEHRWPPFDRGGHRGYMGDKRGVAVFQETRGHCRPYAGLLNCCARKSRHRGAFGLRSGDVGG